ncbi:MAG: RpiB/LacA/LacB family sugar-phosphate isomerase, partial [Chloroflexi bacterium]|nr:RpiB/LacA/LacB family sugar-phosphate isomerase [Chloroflexota bacterium]
MPSQIDDAQIHQIVRRVIERTMSTPQPRPEAGASPIRAESTGRRIVALGADHGGFELKEALKSEVSALGFEIQDVGTNSKE